MLGVEIAGLKVDELAALLLGGLRRIIFAATTGTLSPSGLRLRRSCLPGRAGKLGPSSASCLSSFAKRDADNLRLHSQDSLSTPVLPLVCPSVGWDAF